MLFLVGFSSLIHADVIKDVVKATPNEFVSGLPANDWGGYSKEYMSECLESILAFHEGRRTCFDKGLVIVAFKGPATGSINPVLKSMYPFAIVREVCLDRRLASSGGQLARDKNEVSRLTVSAAKKALRIRNQVNTYITSRCNRTPFLLPIRHFGGDAISGMIQRAWEQLRHADQAELVLDTLAKAFEREFPFTKGKKSSGYFINSRHVEFRSPGRDLHGVAHPNMDGHEEECFLNGSLRMGGQIRPGFHYDCTLKGGKYAGTFEDCHGENVAKEGNPHLNVYPNDFVR